MTFVGGYTVFLAGKWSVATFLFSYTMIGVFPLLFVSWKVLKKTKFLKPEEVDLRGGVEEIEEYSREYVPVVSKYVCLFSSLLFSPLFFSSFLFFFPLHFFSSLLFSFLLLSFLSISHPVYALIFLFCLTGYDIQPLWKVPQTDRLKTVIDFTGC